VSAPPALVAATTATTATTPGLRRYQQQGVSWLLQVLRDTGQRRGALLADEPGLGKSAQALAAAHEWNARRIIIVGPAIARGSWALEILKFAPDLVPHLSVVPPDAGPGEFGLDQPELVLVLSYDTFSRASGAKRWLNALDSRTWDLGVFDEAHYLKNDSARTRALYGASGEHAGLQAACERVLLLTGTPTPNNAGELWEHYRTFWPDLLHARQSPDQYARALTREEWQERFTVYEDTVRFGRQVRGSKNQETLRAKLGPVVLRRRRRDVLPELPPVQIQDVALALDPSSAQILDQLGADRDRAPEDEQSLSRVRRVLGEAKTWPAAAWATERMGLGDDKLLLFAWHRGVIERLALLLREFDPVTITGDTAPLQRTARVQRFQHDPKCRLFVGQVLAAGTAITLTSAHHVGIVEPSWVPGENDQAIARAHRLGQKHPVLASFLFLPGTLDQVIMQTFRRKAEDVVRLVAHTPATA
jgi:SWI/SNF-related matrix-associated actin-dependent regulator 1 of chromatin subfamily A